MKRFTFNLAAVVALACAATAAEPKRLLVVGATASFRHPSIENGAKMIRQLAEKSGGQFTAIFMSENPDYPKYPPPGARGGGGGRGGRGGAPAFAGQVADATADQQAAITTLGESLAGVIQAATTARTAFTAAVFASNPNPTEVKAKLDALAAAELALATAQADGLTRLQATPNRLKPEQIQALAGMGPGPRRGGGRGGPGGGGADPALAKVFQTFMSLEALKNFDGVFFVNTTGNLPIPDLDAFLKWVADGHGVMGLHAAMDTTLPDSYVEMFAGGARFAGHPGGGQTARNIIRIEPNHPATKDWSKTLAVVDEFYQFRNLDRAKVQSLLEMDFEGQMLPVTWAKTHGKGRVFYTSMGHRDDVLLPDIPSLDYGNGKMNPNEVSEAYQKHVLGGIRWALGLVDADSRPSPSRP